MRSRTNVSRLAGLVLAAAASTAILFAPAALATPVSFDFSVNVTSGPLSGNTYNGNFSYDSSSIIAGGSNDAAGLLTALNFNFNGNSYDANTVNTGSLVFDSAGTLSFFMFGTDCSANLCLMSSGTDGLLVSPDYFAYTLKGDNGFYSKSGANAVTYDLAPVHVPEPGSLGMYCFGILLLLAASASRRRWTTKRIER